jgi:threonine dehydrogenase-like Zn-dependent dehydrogenase
LRERELVGSYGSEPDDLREVLDLVQSGRLQLPRLVGDVIPLAEILDGMRRVEAGDTGGSRIVIAIAEA